MRLTVFLPEEDGAVFEVAAPSESLVWSGARGIWRDMGNDYIIPLLRRGFFFLREDDGRTVHEGQINSLSGGYLP